MSRSSDAVVDVILRLQTARYALGHAEAIARRHIDAMPNELLHQIAAVRSYLDQTIDRLEIPDIRKIAGGEF